MTTIAPPVYNGVDTARMFATLDHLDAEPELGRFQFRATNEWLGGAHNRSTIQSFYGAGQEDATRAGPFTLDAGEPAILLGHDEAPNPAEAYLHALAACMTTTIVYAAAARGITLTRLTSRIEGDADVRGALGRSADVRNGYERVSITFDLEGDAPPEVLHGLVERARQRSFVYDCVTNGVPVTVSVAGS